jgi:1-acyl-sn-glycerol-3-phosphate acyltransferase
MFRKKWLINLFLAFTRLTGILPALLLFKPRIRRQGNAKRQLPKNCILVSNHKSLMDFVLYLVIFPFKTIRFLAAEVLFSKNTFLAGLLYGLGCIRVDREGKNFGFVSHALEVLEQGGTVGIFPEGRLPIGGKPFPFTVSAAFIATHANAPVVPIYTDGRYGIGKRAGVVIGEPFFLADYCKEGLSEDAQLKHLTEVLRQKVYDLQKELN